MSTALTRTRGRTDVALPEQLIEQARTYAVNSRSERTKKEYARCWRQFTDWCRKMGFEPLPASVQTLVAYVTDIASSGGPKGTPLSKSTIDQSLSALKLAHSTAGHSLEAFGSPILKEVRKGINREITGRRGIRRVKPLLETDLRDLLEMLKPEAVIDARDAALLALGFGAARRRSELVGLDYMQLGDGDGVLTIDEKGVHIRLARSKTNQEGVEEIYVVPKMAAPRICAAVENWIEVGGIAKGTPVFRTLRNARHSKHKPSGYVGVSWSGDASPKGPWQAVVRVDGKLRHLGYYKDAASAHHAICDVTGAPRTKPFAGNVTDKRMTAHAVATVVKHRIGDLIRASSGRKKLKAEDIAAAIAEYSGHSMRAGHVTSAADRGVPTHHIRAATGHKTDTMISVYSRVSDKVKNSSLKGSGL